MALHRETDGDPETGMQAESDDEEEGERKNDESTRERKKNEVNWKRKMEEWRRGYVGDEQNDSNAVR